MSPAHATVREGTLAELLLSSTADRSQRRSLRRQWRALLWPLAVTTVLLAAWTISAPLAGAVVAPAQLKV